MFSLMALLFLESGNRGAAGSNSWDRSVVAARVVTLGPVVSPAFELCFSRLC